MFGRLRITPSKDEGQFQYKNVVEEYEEYEESRRMQMTGNPHSTKKTRIKKVFSFIKNSNQYWLDDNNKKRNFHWK